MDFFGKLFGTLINIVGPLFKNLFTVLPAKVVISLGLTTAASIIDT